MRPDEKLTSGHRVPESGRVVPGTGEQTFAIRAEDGVIDGFTVPDNQTGRAIGFKLPEPHHARAVRRENQTPIRAERRRINARAVTQHRGERPACRAIPYAGGVVPTGGQNTLSVRGPAGGGDHIVVFQRWGDRFQRGCVPHLGRRVKTRRE